MAERILTTDTLFEQEALPASLAVVGLGAIGVEIGQALARLGCVVTGITQSEHVAGLTDPVVTTSLREALQREFPIHVGRITEVAEVESKLE